MLIFIDESGDTGLKLDQGSSTHFSIGLVLFESREVAELCSQRIDKLRRELELPRNFEFHFHKNKSHIKEAFLRTISDYDFSYTAIAIDKREINVDAPTFRNKDAFYLFACDKVFTEILPFLENALITIDQIGSENFRVSLRKRLLAKNTFDFKSIADIQQKKSHKINLLQVADYIASMVNSRARGKTHVENYFKIIVSKEFSHIIYP